MRLPIVLLSLCLAACAGRLRVELDPTQPIQRAERRLNEQVGLTPGTGCLLAWGELPALSGERPLRVVAGTAILDVVAVCDRPGQLALLRDRRIKQTALLFFRGGRFLVGHPADTSAKSELPASAERRSDLLGLFADPNPEGSAEEVVRALSQLTKRFLLAVWDPAA